MDKIQYTVRIQCRRGRPGLIKESVQVPRQQKAVAAKQVMDITNEIQFGILTKQ